MGWWWGGVGGFLRKSPPIPAPVGTPYSFGRRLEGSKRRLAPIWRSAGACLSEGEIFGWVKVVRDIDMGLESWFISTMNEALVVIL